MPTHPIPDDVLQQTVNIMAASKTQTDAAATMGISRQCLQNRLAHAERRGIVPREAEFETDELPDDIGPIEDLLERRKKKFQLVNDAKTARRLIDVRIKVDGPVGIVHFGDPHTDDDGCDIAKLERHQNIVNRTKGMFGANLGDLQNNWVGRLSHLWSQQTTSAQEAWRLTEWHVRSVCWLYLVGGNHDAWSGSGDPLDWIMRQQPGVYGYNGTRINLIFPNGKTVRINARHDFTGHSMWNPAHGPMKAAQGGWRDHLLTCGHKHTSFVAGPLKDPASGLLTWAVRCAGYKTHDRYADEKGLPDQNAFAAAVTIIDPQFGDDDPRLMTVIPDVEEGADYLTWKRKRAAA
jgi:hypothetical protein